MKKYASSCSSCIKKIITTIEGVWGSIATVVDLNTPTPLIINYFNFFKNIIFKKKSVDGVRGSGAVGLGSPKSHRLVT